MAVDWKPEPPRTLAAWLDWQLWCQRQGKFERWAEVVALSWDGGWQEEWHPGPSFSWRGDDHPFQGCTFCWRCLASAQDLPTSNVPHCRETGTICWNGEPGAGIEQQQADDAPAEDRDTDSGEAKKVISVDVAYLGSTVISSDGLHIARYDAEGNPLPEAVDTGTLFYIPPSKYAAIREELTDFRWHPPYGEPTEESREAVRRLAKDLGLPSEFTEWPTDLQSPVPDESERPAPAAAEPAEADYRDSWPPSWTDDGPGEAAGNAGPGPDTEPGA